MKKGKKECKAIGCNRTVRHTSFCEEHRCSQGKRKANKSGSKERDAIDRIYKKQRWRRVREQKLKQSPLCEKCWKEGKTKEAEIVDHITPIRKGGDAHNLSNLQSLCHAHHNKKTAFEKGPYNKPREG